jgi:hypothetical protein
MSTVIMVLLKMLEALACAFSGADATSWGSGFGRQRQKPQQLAAWGAPPHTTPAP